MTKISIQPDKLYKMSDDMVKEIMNLEEIMNDLNKKMSDVVNSLSQGPHYSPEYYTAMQGAFMHHAQSKYLVGQLKDEISEAEIYSRNTAEKFEEEDSLFSKLFNIYNDYQGFVAAGTIASHGLFFQLSGLSKYVKVNGKWEVRHNGYYQQLLKSVDDSKFRAFARTWANKRGMFKYKNEPLESLLYKKYSKFFPDDVTKFTNGMMDFKSSIKNTGMLNTLKNHTGDLLKAGSKFGKTNAAIGLVISAGSASVGLGMDVVDNYRKYGGNEAVLKRENAKAVGRAANTLIVEGGFTAAGGVVGGAIGSIGGPVGTVIGASIGGAIGSMVGEKVAAKTAGFFEDAALIAKEPIHATIETVKGGVEAVGKGIDAVEKGVDKVKDTASSLIDGGKKFFSSKLSFGW
ncbi:hypothetical protein [Fictibacillus sp. KU28468]|uniref:hypothetical protein n=1 Tax=Fictibacillus sp. KU28468 TaxID=2991053 RepID=UPI00223D5554|nr:hypothetical protein [Fictibacillus sp. KU28468]UZJ78716.1 hypothetical protein OKX00_21825 [Fictibacillus sp. KU28468]